MKIFLVQNVPNLGKAGEEKEVSSSYAINFLLPKKLAVLPGDQKALEIKKKNIEKTQKEMENRSQQEEIIASLDGRKYVIKAKVDTKGHLYGSIGPKELAKETGLDESYFKEHFKQIGSYNLEIKFGDKKANIQIEIKDVS